MGIENVTATGTKAREMAKHGRFGDTEMVHAQPGEKVIPLSIQTPAVRRVISDEFARQGVPEERYEVKSTENSNNPATGKNEFFLKDLVSAAAPIVGGMVGGPAGAAVGSAIGGAISGGGSSAGGAAPAAYGGTAVEQNPLPQPVKAVVESGGMAPASIASLTPITGGDERLATATQLGQGSQAQSVVGPRAVAPAGIMGMTPLNPTTGAQQFYDIGSGNGASINPTTGRPEFYGWTGSAQNVNDWAVENFNNLNPQQQQVLVEELRKLPVEAGSGNRSNYLATNPQVNQQLMSNLRAKGFQVGSGGNTYVAPSSAPSAPAPANVNNTPAYVAPAGTASGQQPAAASPAQQTITGMYATDSQGLPAGQSPFRVMTAGGDVFEVVHDPYTNKVDYKKVEGLGNYQALSESKMQGIHRGMGPAGQTIAFGNDNVGYNVVSLGGKFDYTDPDTQKESESTATTYDTPNQKPYGNKGLDTVTSVPKPEDKPVDMGGLYGGRGNDVINMGEPPKKDSPPDWYYGLQSQLDEMRGLMDKGDDADTEGSSTISTVTAPSDSGNLKTTSTLTPTRGDRFKSRTREGGLARNF